MRRTLTSGIALLWCAAASVSAADLADIDAIQNAQNSFVSNNGGAADLQLQLEAQLALMEHNANFALVDQIEGSGHRATIDQRGDSNAAAVIQGFGNDSSASLSQSGNGNFALVVQQGNNNVVSTLLQAGDGNRATLTQQGNNNTAAVSQYNDNNQLSLSQVDGFNQIQVSQYGNTRLGIVQTNANGGPGAINNLNVEAYTEPGYSPVLKQYQQDGAGSHSVLACTGSAAYCANLTH
jgi:Curlin associated repeat